MDEIRIEYARTLIMALQNCPTEYAGPIVDEFIASNVTDGPIVSLHDITQDANFWADIATPTELRVYLGAILKRLAGQPFGHATRKKLFVQLWESMAIADRHAFLMRVDPNGNFQRGIAA